MNLDPKHGIALFTDGSAYRRNKSGGWAWVALDAFRGTHVDAGYVHDVTNNQMELYAPTTGLMTLYVAFGSIEVLVYSDSEYVVLGSTDRTRARRKNVDWWQDLDNAVDLHTHVQFLHVKGHSSNPHNNRADKLAGQARKERIK